MVGAVLFSAVAAVGSAAAYGVATAGQHAAATASQHSAATAVRDERSANTAARLDPSGLGEPARPSLAGLAALLRDPRWLLATAGDLVGVILQVVALAYGPVVLVQPILVLSLPIAIVVRPWFGAPRPTGRQLVDCAVLMAGLALFLAAIGNQSRGQLLQTRQSVGVLVVALVVGGLAWAASVNLRPTLRAVVLGSVAGGWFGVVGVLVEAVSAVWQRRGLAGFGTAEGWLPLGCLLILAVGAYLLIQLAFQSGPLAPSFAANLLVAPLVAVLLGATLLGERLPADALHYLAYAAAVAAVGWSALRLIAAPDGRQSSSSRPLQEKT